jgi:hypothetical protein
MHEDSIEMIEEFVTNPEFETYFPKLNGMRRRIARDLPIKVGASEPYW